MKQNINEIKRMQQLAGLITEAQLNENENLPSVVQDVLENGDFVRITPTTEVTVGKNVLGMYNGMFGEITKISGDKYKVTYDAYGDTSVLNRQNLEKKFLIEK
jgi:hypothetical protein